ncbi:hypothetical protein [Gulosibacter chungangensis]|uniref:Lipoprotein n=1 Tax=Gulosibacter chungangensis TaxID=979746 RepID=A0A7J5BBK7_9MICO|nr:hypothetical protein [Gulosibacter chungangensis]KAB1643533.1 hypothetical protein F8O05_06510 [Gulosibacter chungangensis]
MSARPFLRVGFGLAASLLALSLTACAGGQSVAQACLQTNVALAETNAALGPGLDTAVQNAISGEDVDFGEVFDPINEALSTATDAVSNKEVSDALAAFTTEVESFGTTLEEADFQQFVELNELEPGSEEYEATVDEVETASLELYDKLDQHITDLTNAGDQITTICQE